jgi:ABC-type polysaccharide/polyol phosphate transport system ATPase subunit
MEIKKHNKSEATTHAGRWPDAAHAEQDPGAARPAGAVSGQSAIHAFGVSKTFLLPTEKRDTLKENVLHYFRHRRGLKRAAFSDFHALQDVNLRVDCGEFLGVVGKNGSGKSTLLKILAGIYSPSSGRVSVDGKVAPFLELGIGFQPELSARDNIRINATLLGMDRDQIRESFNIIVEFAEIREFLDLKLKNFSSGMRARLAFAIAKEADADIYLCDEVLAVGDEAFQQKCIRVFKEWHLAGKTIVLVSHNSDMVRDLCTRAVLIENGRIVADGLPANVVNSYHLKG